MSKSYEPWIKIPRRVINLSLDNELVVPVFVYLCAHKTQHNRVFGSVHKMAHYCGLVPNGRAGMSNDRCSAALEILKDEGYCKNYSEPGYAYRRHEHHFEMDDAKCDIDSNYAKIELREIDKLLAHRNSPGKKMDCSSSYEKLIRVLAYIRLNQCTVQDDDSELIYGLLKTEQIACDLEIVASTALNAVTVLRNLCVIDYQTYRVQGRDQQWRTVGNIYIPNEAQDNSDLFDKISGYLKTNNPYR